MSKKDGRFEKGQNPRNKGLKMKEPSKKKGKCLSIETKQKVSDGLRRYWATIPKEKRPEHFSEKHRKNISKSLEGRVYSKETCKKLSERWQNPDYVRNMLQKLHSKTKPEQQIETLLQQLYPNEFKYNGCFECGVSLNGLIPDFVNINGQKKVIEVFGDYWHYDEEVLEKQRTYEEVGFSSLIIWQSELKNKKEIIERIIDFVGKRSVEVF